MLKRLAFFAYGVACYVVFLATFLYAIGFIGNLGTPTALDAPATGSVVLALAIDAVLLAAVRAAAQRHGPSGLQAALDADRAQADRALDLCAVLESGADSALLAVAADRRPRVVGRQHRRAVALLRTLFAFGWVLVLIATFLIDHFDLFGLRQVSLFLVGRPYTSRAFATPGLYRLVRHPLYVGWFFAFWATPTMTVAHLVFAIATSAYILIAIQLEERDLVREFGDTYEDYRRRVPMLIPSPRAKQDAPVARELTS